MALEKGNSLTSIFFDSGTFPATGVIPVFKGVGYGFIIEPAGIALPHSTLVKIKIGGYQNVGNDDFWAMPNTWYWAPFSSINVVRNDKLAFGDVDVGQWVCNIATQPYAHVQPASTSGGFAGVPAAGGGSPPLNGSSLTQNVAGVIPTLNSQGIALGASAQLESTYQIFAQNTAAGTLLSGGVDVWRYVDILSGYGTGWFLVAQNILLPIGGTNAGATTFDLFGPRLVGDRLFVTSSAINPIVWSDGNALVYFYMRIQ